MVIVKRFLLRDEMQWATLTMKNWLLGLSYSNIDINMTIEKVLNKTIFNQNLRYSEYDTLKRILSWKSNKL